MNLKKLASEYLLHVIDSIPFSSVFILLISLHLLCVLPCALLLLGSIFIKRLITIGGFVFFIL